MIDPINFLKLKTKEKIMFLVIARKKEKKREERKREKAEKKKNPDCPAKVTLKLSPKRISFLFSLSIVSPLPPQQAITSKIHFCKTKFKNKKLFSQKKKKSEAKLAP